MRVERGASQVLFGFLPEQTVDLEGRVWRVTRWSDPPVVALDQDSVRRAVQSAASPWNAPGMNDGICDELLHGAAVEIVEVNRRFGVEVEAFPGLWRCRACNRVTRRAAGRCACTSERRRAQIHYVEFHSCGVMQEPPIPQCPTHHESAMELPGSAAVRDLRFYCPVCDKTLNRGFPFRNCSCGNGPMERTVHRAAKVFTPRFTVLVNPLDPGRALRMRAAGGAVRALEWVLEGMQGRDPSEGQQTIASLIDSLKALGISEATARDVAQGQLAKGIVREATGLADIAMNAPTKDAAEDEAFSLGAALTGGRTTIDEMSSKVGPPLRTVYESAYPRAMAAAGLEGVDFIPNFPVVTLAYGYTRGDSRPGAARLIAFRERGQLRAYGDSNQTEALLFRLDPLRVHAWLDRRGLVARAVPVASTRAARIAVLEQVAMPSAIEEHPQPLGNSVLSLLHSFAHRAIRHMAAFAGTDRDSLAEYLLPHHLAFVVYAARRSDFVLGGLQALYETSLDGFLDAFLSAESRCPLDPGCRKGGGACMACLHIGEASCRWYNRFLDRAHLFGPYGYLR